MRSDLIYSAMLDMRSIMDTDMAPDPEIINVQRLAITSDEEVVSLLQQRYPLLVDTEQQNVLIAELRRQPLFSKSTILRPRSIRSIMITSIITLAAVSSAVFAFRRKPHVKQNV